MSRARARKQQETETFFQENPDLRPAPEGPPLVVLDEFDLLLTTVPDDFGGEDGFSIQEDVVGEYTDIHETHPFASDPAIGTITEDSFGQLVGVVALDSPDGVDSLLQDPIPYILGSDLGLTADGIGVVGEDEFDADPGPFPDGFDTINDGEVLQLLVGFFDSSPLASDIGFNFLVQDGSGTVELLLIDLDEKSDDVIASQKVTAEVEAGVVEGGLSAGLAGGFDAAFIGVTGDLEITVTGVGVNGDFDNLIF